MNTGNPLYLEAFDLEQQTREAYVQSMQTKAQSIPLASSAGMMQSVVSTTVSNMLLETPVLQIAPFPTMGEGETFTIQE
jgi:hypothetical protein